MLRRLPLRAAADPKRERDSGLVAAQGSWFVK